MTKRNEKLIIDYRDKLLAKSLSFHDIHNLLKDIRNADITGGKYARFLLDCYLNNRIRQEDLKGGIESTVGQSILLFHKYKDRKHDKKCIDILIFV